MSNQTILLIDYDPVSIGRTTTPLTKAGYQVEVAKDGISGLAAFERTKPALVLVEAMLPRKHGFEVCQEIKAKPEGKSTPVLITTAVCRGRKYRMDALQIYGCDEYIEKPIADDELVSIITRFIDEAKQARNEVREDLSDAIDVAAVDVPAAIESMDDDELEAKIDALLMGGDTPAESEKTATPPVAPIETVVAEEPPEAPAETVLVLLEQDDEATALAVQTPEIKEEPAAPLAEVATDAVAEPEVREWTETHAPEKKSGSKVVLFGVAAAALVAVVGFLAFQQGWIGGRATPEPTSTDGDGSVSRLANHLPAPVQDIVAQEPVEAAATEPEIAEAQPESSENVAPKPIVPPQPTFKRRSARDLQSARNRQAQADRALTAAAGSLQSQLLSAQAGDSVDAQDAPIQAVDIEADDLIGTPVRPEARRGELFALNEVDRAPVRVRFEQPVYDELARRSKQEGVVVVEVLIDETGQVAEARLVQQIPRSRLNEASLRAARRWSYQPAVKDGVPVKVWKSERIVFELD